MKKRQKRIPGAVRLSVTLPRGFYDDLSFMADFHHQSLSATLTQYMAESLHRIAVPVRDFVESGATQESFNAMKARISSFGHRQSHNLEEMELRGLDEISDSE